jgi:HK97 gp10 family phage protein
MTVIFSGDWGKNDERLRNALKAASGDDLFEILSPGAIIALRHATEIVPVDTGFLRDSGQLDREDDSPMFGFAADYAEPVEFGTSKMAAQPYVRPAVDNHRDEIEEAMLKKLENKVDK